MGTKKDEILSSLPKKVAVYYSFFDIKFILCYRMKNRQIYMHKKENKGINSEEYHYFVAHEFSRQERDDLRQAIQNAFRGTGLNAYYADLEIRQTHILKKIRDMIFKTQFGIYDISNPNKPNVFLELGLAIASGRSFYIICRKGTEVPADLSGIDRIEYESYKNLTHLLRAKVVEREIEKSKLRYGMESYEREILLRPVKLYQAEELFHRWGKETEDHDAINKKAWSVVPPMPISLKERGLDTHIIYGPYESLPEPSLYKALFKIKTEDNSDPYPILRLEIHSDSLPEMSRKNFRDIAGVEFNCPGIYQLFDLNFEYQSQCDIQYRVKILKEVSVWIDYVALVKL